MTLEFAPQTHIYTLNGSRIPSVTGVLRGEGFLQDTSRIAKYYRDRGQRTHDILATDLKYGVDPEHVAPDIRPFLDRFRAFAELVGLEPVRVEERLYCEIYRYAGTIDFYGMVNGKPWLLDWKSGATNPGYKLQVAGGYLPLVQQAEHRHDIKCGIVTLTADPPKIHEITGTDHVTVFRAALMVHNWKQRCLKGAA